MAIEVVPLPIPHSADHSKFVDFGREVKGVDPGNFSSEQFQEIRELLFKVSYWKALLVFFFFFMYSSITRSFDDADTRRIA